MNLIETLCNAGRAIRTWLHRFVRICWPTTPEVAKPLLPIVEKYFEDHPEAKDGVMKACYAWHDDIDAPYRHVFVGKERNSECRLCGRSREQVRYDDLPEPCAVAQKAADMNGVHRFGGSAPWTRCIHCDQTREELDDWIQPEPGGYGYKRCPKYKVTDIKGTLYAEEVKFLKLLERAEKEVPRIIKKLGGMSGETLAVLRHTHGYDPETVDGVVNVPTQIIADYHAAMETERDRSRAAIVREVVTARTTGDSAANANDQGMP